METHENNITIIAGDVKRSFQPLDFSDRGFECHRVSDVKVFCGSAVQALLLWIIDSAKFSSFYLIGDDKHERRYECIKTCVCLL